MPDVNCIALWQKSIIKGTVIYDRQYALRADGVISTRLDAFHGRRDLASLKTEGWQRFKGSQTSAQIDKQLLPKGYKRLF